MKSKEVLIKIIDKHDDGDGSYSAELTMVGTFSGSADNYTVTYTETEEELEGCTTVLTVEGGSKITMTRSGRYVSELVIEKDKRHSCHYSTPYGDFMMGVYARSIESVMDKDGGELNFCYTIDFNTGLASVNTLTVLVMPLQEDKCDVSIS